MFVASALLFFVILHAKIGLDPTGAILVRFIHVPSALSAHAIAPIDWRWSNHYLVPHCL